jgi:hypothetical protein
VATPCRRHAGIRVRRGCVQVSMSFDVPAHRHLPIEIYGTSG